MIGFIAAWLVVACGEVARPCESLSVHTELMAARARVALLRGHSLPSEWTSAAAFPEISGEMLTPLAAERLEFRVDVAENLFCARSTEVPLSECAKLSEGRSLGMCRSDLEL